MTKVYFVRHAQADDSVRDGRNRPLTEKGFVDRKLVTDFLADKEIDVVLSSPYKRAVDTIADFAEMGDFEICLIEEYKERRSDSDWDRTDDVWAFHEKQWADFSYTLSDGETLGEVQARNVNSLKDILARHKGKNIAIGTHGTALSTIINHYDNTYGFEDFKTMVHIAPWVVVMEFDGDNCLNIEKIDLFNGV